MNKDEHRKRFGSVATEYHSEKYPGRYNCLMFVLDYLNPQKSDIVLDVGCGPGNQLIELSSTIKFGYGIDLSKEMIKVAQNRSKDFENLKFMVSSADSLPDELTNAGISKIYSNYALHHLPDNLKYESIASLSKLLEQGGKLIIGDLMFSENPRDYSNLYEYAGYGPESDTPSTVPNLLAMFENAGFRHTVRLLNPIIGIIIGEK